PVRPRGADRVVETRAASRIAVPLGRLRWPEFGCVVSGSVALAMHASSQRSPPRPAGRRVSSMPPRLRPDGRYIADFRLPDGSRVRKLPERPGKRAAEDLEREIR